MSAKRKLQVIPTSKEPPVPDQNSVQAEASTEFVNNAYIQEITNRALAYLEVGYPIHLCGPAGTGKTTLAFHIAAQLTRPVTLIHGDDEFGSSDLVGRDSGYKKSKVVDNYIHTVLKTEEEWSSDWQDNRLTTACKQGFTLIYDEFTRSKPEANNALLSVLEEKILNLPKLQRQGDGYLEVHPQFRAIFTSNPEEYVGVHKTQDALMDRLITIQLDHLNRATEVQIAMSKSGLKQPDAERIVDIVREMRQLGVNNHRPTIRAIIAIARITAHFGATASLKDAAFVQTCRDVLNSDTTRVTRGGKSEMDEKIDEIIQRICRSHVKTRKTKEA